jgi:hypothetical protein
MLDVDHLGLDVMDRKLLGAMLEKFGGGPVGVDNLAAAIGEARDTIEDVLEPYLIQQGYLQRTPRGISGASPRRFGRSNDLASITSGNSGWDARNIGARAATAPWLGFFDADILLADRFSASVLPALRTGNYYRASPVTLQTWGSIICHRDDFFRINGYDEAYSGWGGEDDDLLAMLALHRVAGHGYPAALLDEVGHGDERRTQFAAVKNRWLQSRINQIYLHAKLDLIRLRGIPPTVQESRLIFAEIERTVLQANAAGNADCAINLSLPEQTLGSPPHDGMIELNSLARSLSYKLSFIGTRSSPGVPQLNLPMIDCGESA